MTGPSSSPPAEELALLAAAGVCVLGGAVGSAVTPWALILSGIGLGLVGAAIWMQKRRFDRITGRRR